MEDVATDDEDGLTLTQAPESSASALEKDEGTGDLGNDDASTTTTTSVATTPQNGRGTGS
jgi:hypothetical protein